MHLNIDPGWKMNSKISQSTFIYDLINLGLII